MATKPSIAALASRNAWILPFAFAAGVAGVGWSSYTELERSMKHELASKLETVRDSTVEALRLWSEEIKAVIRVHAERSEIRSAAQTMIELARTSGGSREALLAAPEMAELRARLASVTEEHRFAAWAVVAANGTFVAATTDRNIGGHVPGVQADIDRMAAGETIITAPTIVRLLDHQPVSLMLIGGPIRDESGRPIGVFGFSLNPAEVYGRLLVVGRPGATGDSYAFDDEGVLISPVRFAEQLREVGALPADSSVQAPLNIQIRDPGGNRLEGFEPTTTEKARAFTVAAAGAISGQDGVDVAGYRDYRGVPVLGAWAWLPGLGVGIASEIEAAEAYAGLDLLRTQFSILVGVLLLAALGMGVYSIVLARLSRQVQEARLLGRYRVVRKLGQGGMGTVYLANHALLRRPAAVKVLEGEAAGADAASRFEREVQVTSTLQHPNTIQVFDYGHVPDGAFYYAMEYVRGLTLQDLVLGEGALPEARAKHILRQIAGSLAEAHALGVVHRDIKPSNIMLCERGGVPDFVKVLDFGLARPRQSGQDLGLTHSQAITGSPLYMSPEALENPRALDARGDVYQLGAVAFFLLTGAPPFSGENMVEVLAKHLKHAPPTPSAALGRPVSPDLERLVLRCLEKDAAARFENAAALLAALEDCRTLDDWTPSDAQAWWRAWDAAHPAADSRDDAGSSPGSTPSGWSVDLGRRLES